MDWLMVVYFAYSPGLREYRFPSQALCNEQVAAGNFGEAGNPGVAFCVPVEPACAPPTPTADMDGNGVIDAADFALFREAFERGVP